MDKITEVFGEIAGNRINTRFRLKQQNARNRGIEFSLKEEDFILMGPKLLGYGTCDYTGAKLELSRDTPVGQFHPTIERVDDTKGYVRGNVCIVCERANLIKDIVLDKKFQTVKLCNGDVSLLKAMVRRFERGTITKVLREYDPATTKSWPDKSQVWLPQYVDNPSMHPSTKGAVEMDALVSDDKPVMENTMKNNEVDTKQESTMSNPVSEAVSIDLPEDVQISIMYANVCKAAARQGMEVSITFGQFKSLWRVKRCFITGRPVVDHYPVILDKSLPLGVGNLKFSNEKEGAAFYEFMEKLGITAFELEKKLRVA